MDIVRLHGTDGIRGRICPNADGENPIEKLVFQREISPEFFALVGEATGQLIVQGNHIQCGRGGAATLAGSDQPLIAVGWDRRAGNRALVAALVQGLRKSGCRAVLVGEVPTPGLHRSMVTLRADAGMMVTASHNPAEDSGVKLFDGYGFKSMPQLEDVISERIFALAESDVGGLDADGDRDDRLESDSYDGLQCYRAGLKSWLDELLKMYNIDVASLNESIAYGGLLVDSSGGAATEWLATGLSRRGIESSEVSNRDTPINLNCGAGEFSPTDRWTSAELMENEHQHALLDTLADRLRENDGMAPWQEGDILGAALDGDGDRCLIIEADSNGARIIDGDQIAFDWLNALATLGTKQANLAFTIESDLSLPTACKHLNVKTTQVAVGDRWLSDALRRRVQSDGWVKSQNMPMLIGCEDSGHLIMPQRHPHDPSSWSLVGDGVATLLAYLIARTVLGEKRVILNKGWKARHTVKPSDRSRWNATNQLAENFREVAVQNLTEASLEKIDIPGETSLLLLIGDLHSTQVSIGVRNSGTEEKTALTIKTDDSRVQLEDLLRVGGEFLDNALKI